MGVLGGGGWSLRREGPTVEGDRAPSTCLLSSCQLACWRSCRDSAGTARDSPEQLLLFLPPWRSVSVTKSNFGPRSAGVWDVPHSMPGPVVFRISFKANRVTRWRKTTLAGSPRGCRWGSIQAPGESAIEAPGHDFSPVL